AVVSKSPLTNRLNDSLASSGFAIAGKKLGCDAIVIRGQAPNWSILILDDDDVRLETAEHLVGMTVPDTEHAVREQVGEDFRIAAIGPAGENLVRYATISHDGRHAGRGGSGAVLGSKRIKALAIRGTRSCDWAAPPELASYAKSLSAKSFGPATAKYRELGTATNLLAFNRLGALPTRNFQQGSFEAAEQISPELLASTRERTRAYCAACTIGCEHLYASTHKSASGKGEGVRLEYENLFALGPLCGVGDPDVVLAASRRCDELGIDTISAGGTVAFAMECAELGLIDEPQLRFGSGDALLATIDRIAQRENIGDLLAEGNRIMSQTVGQGSEAFAPHVKGLEIPGYEPRALQTMALGFAVGSRGADHNRSGAYEADFSGDADRHNIQADDARHAIATEDRAALMDSLIICKFLRGVFDDFFAEASEMLNLVTGWNTTDAELREVAGRIVAAKHHFNVLAGWTPDEDNLPERFLTTALEFQSQEVALPHASLAAAVRRYYELRGWSRDGRIPVEELGQLGIEAADARVH
ncbi:MAG: hypothetical protein MI757_08195, partial [Pirellulales bacterium]|nr:hypothetical protein [Pirellulales bacterium]